MHTPNPFSIRKKLPTSYNKAKERRMKMGLLATGIKFLAWVTPVMQGLVGGHLLGKKSSPLTASITVWKLP